MTKVVQDSSALSKGHALLFACATDCKLLLKEHVPRSYTVLCLRHVCMQTLFRCSSISSHYCCCLHIQWCACALHTCGTLCTVMQQSVRASCAVVKMSICCCFCCCCLCCCTAALSCSNTRVHISCCHHCSFANCDYPFKLCNRKLS
jgi:hypothetical protein